MDWLRLMACATVLLVAAGLLRGDVIVLRDGSRIEGKVRRSDGGWTVTLADGSSVFVGSEDVRSLEMTPATRPTNDVALARLTSLRRSVENLADPRVVVDRYRQYLEMNDGTPAAEQAREDLKLWQERVERGLRKLGNRWVDPAEFEQLVVSQTRAALEARALIKAGRSRDAEALLRQVLADDPANISALYLLGVLQFRQDQLAPAKRCFEQVLQTAPQHAPSLNNIAVVLFRQRQYGASLSFYEQALSAAPGQRDLLDNVAEAMEAAPDEVRKGLAGQRLARRFAEQDRALQRDLAERGLFRWGSTWIDRAELERLQEAEKQINQRLADLDRDREITQQRISRINRDIEANEQTLRTIEQQSWVKTPDGRMIRVAYPPAYYDIQRDIRRLKSERDELQLRTDALREESARTKQRLPKPKFTGVQQLIGEDGVPLDESALRKLLPPLPTDPVPQPAPTPGTQPAPTPGTQPAATPGTQPPPTPSDTPPDDAIPATMPTTQPG
jgi:tetratricopeptide (TPR) repeat protein